MSDHNTSPQVEYPMELAICDDEPAFAQQLQQMIHSHAARRDWAYRYQLYQQPEKLLAADLSQVGALFLDVDMPGLDGISVARRFREQYPELIIVFVTGFLEYAPDGYYVNAFRCLLKGKIDKELPDCLDAIFKKLYALQEVLHVKHEDQTVPLHLRDILYLEGTSRRHTYFHLQGTSGGSILDCVGKLSEFEAELQGRGFLRIQRSYLVNMVHISRIKAYNVTLATGEALGVSEKNYTAISRQYVLWKGQKL